jgi:hypothetical protein
MVGNFRLVGNAKVILGRSSASCRGPKPASGHVPQPDLTNNVMDQNGTSGPRQWESVLAHTLRVARDSEIMLWTAKMPFQVELVLIRPVHDVHSFPLQVS